VQRLSLSARLTALVLALLLAALTLIGVTLALRVQAFASAQAAQAIDGQLALIVQAGETGAASQGGAGAQGAYEYQAFQSLVQAAQASRSWGFLKTRNRTYPTDSAPHPLPPARVLAAATQTGRASWHDLRLLADGRGDVLALAVNTEGGRGLTVSVVQSYAVIALGALLLAGAAVLLLLRLGLRPLRVMAAQAARLGVGDLAERMPVAEPEDELKVLARSLNRMLGRLQDAFARLSAEEARTRAFAADASHELRTPLAAISGSLEILERVGGDAEATETRARLVANLRREARRAGRLVDDLLTLTRLDSGEGLRPTRVALTPLLQVVLEATRNLAPGLVFVLDAPAELHLNTDPERLEGALLNLLRNAAAHTPAGGTVTLRAVQQGGWARLSVLNPATLDPAFLPRLFDRFARGPDAAPGGSGLGLAIVRAVAEAQGGSTFAVQHPELLEVGLTLPIS
jgi:two-component system, OmpR family, sensor kinase